MERKQSTIDSESADADDRSITDDPASRTITTTAADSPTATITATTSDDERPSNVLTIIGHGIPSSFEVTVGGEISPLDDDDPAATTVSGSTVEGTIETGTIRFRFTGDLTDVTFVDRRITGQSPAAVPNVHVDYTAPEGSQS